MKKNEIYFSLHIKVWEEEMKWSKTRSKQIDNN